ncbi:MAG: ABC transporter permease subunit [Alphaproteobacteria bacterium]|nr:ABC transporter permease subunit [Alphaproteobacteria bacterium]
MGADAAHSGLQRMKPVANGSDLPVLLPIRLPALPASEFGDRLVAFFASRRAFVAIVVLAASSVAAAAAADAPMRPGIFETVLKWAPLIGTGFLFNLAISVASMMVGTLAGVLLGLGQISLLRPVRAISWVATQFFRNSPWLVLLFFAMFLLPFEIRIGGFVVSLPAWFKAIIGLALPVMANVAEIVRGGINSVPVGQWESAESLAFSRMQTLWRIILPQAVKRMIPPWMNLYAILTMATTLISVVGIQDAMTLTRGALVAEARTELYLPFYSLLLLYFFAYCYPIARLTQRLERRYAVKL